MTIETEKIENEKKDGKMIQISGHIARKLAPAPIRILAIVSGVSLIRGIFSLIGRYLLRFRKKAVATIEKNNISIDIEWFIMGRSFRKTKTCAPIKTIDAARFENRKRYIHLLIGFGSLAVGIWVGIQYLVDGLRAGYPMLALLGAGIVVAGIAIDLIMYLFIPEGTGVNRVILKMGSWKFFLAGVSKEEGEVFVDFIRKRFE